MFTASQSLLAFEHDFIETLRHAEFVEVTTAFGFFDEAGKRVCYRDSIKQ